MQGGADRSSKSGGDNPPIAWLSVLSTTPPEKVVINEMTTVASVWTDAQFLGWRSIIRRRRRMTAENLTKTPPEVKGGRRGSLSL